MEKQHNKWDRKTVESMLTMKLKIGSNLTTFVLNKDANLSFMKHIFHAGLCVQSQN